MQSVTNNLIVKRDYIQSRISKVRFTYLDELGQVWCYMLLDNGVTVKAIAGDRETAEELAFEKLKEMFSFCASEKQFHARKRKEAA